MKLPAGVKVPKLNRNTMVVIGGAGVAAVVYFLSSRGSSAPSADPFAQAPYEELPGGSTEPVDDLDPIIVAPSQVAPPTSDYPAYTPPRTVQRTVAPAPAPIAPTTYADRYGNPATLEQIFAQDFRSTSPAIAQAPSPAPTSTYRAPAPAPAYYADRAGNRVTLDQLLAGFSNSDARQAPTITAVGASYSTPDPTPLYVSPIVARNLKTPGGGLAYPGGAVETYIGGSGAPLSDHTQALLAA